MVKVISVRMHGRGKAYYFDPLDFELAKGEEVVVETSQGVDLGFCSGEISTIDSSKLEHDLKPILRKATDDDLITFAQNLKLEEEAYEIAREKIIHHELAMNLVDVECMLDNQRIVFYFTAEGRIDFRDLVKDLAGIFRTRIELRQIGVRDEARLLGGLGVCGRELCCGSFLQDFNPVSIKTAKEQNLAMNPTKISGACGRLLCCLQYEHDAYVDARKRMPNVGQTVDTSLGKGKITSVNILRETARVLVEVDGDPKTKTFKVEELAFGQKQRVCPCPRVRQELDRNHKDLNVED
ncbi:MAG TPA: stage 0 sporulation family protein [Candidatus Eisenbacteria bacterium]|nr:stage 0 sporulation family protein [Candidatus Eisenbacteria bacterium]